MCQYMLKICQLDEQRFVQQCEHGTVFLTWGHCTWHLMPADFHELGGLLRQGEGKSACFVLDQYDDKSLLWCGDACLMLRGDQTRALLALVNEAVNLVATDPATAYRRATGQRVRERLPELGRLLN